MGGLGRLGRRWLSQEGPNQGGPCAGGRVQADHRKALSGRELQASTQPVPASSLQPAASSQALWQRLPQSLPQKQACKVVGTSGLTATSCRLRAARLCSTSNVSSSSSAAACAASCTE